MAEPLKRFLVFTGSQYYPQCAWRDFIGSFDTLEDAFKGVAENKSDWYQIVDGTTSRVVEQD